MTELRKSSKTRVRLTSVGPDGVKRKADWLATEEPLEIRVTDELTGEPILNHVTMRTPGNDFELAAGLLWAEGIVQRADQIRQMEFCVGPKGSAVQNFNIVSATVTGSDPDRRAGAHFRTAVSACGVCGKASLDELSMRGIEPVPDLVTVDRAVIELLPTELRKRQTLFESTGGLHGAALFTADGEVLAVREDVGRHNAVDKLLGWSLLNPAQAIGRTDPDGQRQIELRVGPEGGRRPDSRAGWRLCTQQSGSRARRRVQPDPDRLPPRRVVQPVHSAATHFALAVRDGYREAH